MKFSEILEKYNIPNIEYLERCIIDYDKYGELGEQIGCPLDVYVKLHNIANIYNRYGEQYKIKKVQGSVVIVIENSELVYIPLKDYKKTWWLKKDKSE